MNKERILELAAKSGFDVERLMTPYPGGFPREDMLALECFAELIVLECVEVLRLVAYCADDKPDFGDEVVFQEAVKKHFGVEE